MMPLYTFLCRECGKEMDKFHSISDCPIVILCDRCRGIADKIISIGHGGIQTDGDVKWLASACETLQTPYERREKPITTRTEYHKCLKEKGLIAIG